MILIIYPPILSVWIIFIGSVEIQALLKINKWIKHTMAFSVLAFKLKSPGIEGFK